MFGTDESHISKGRNIMLTAQPGSYQEFLEQWKKHPRQLDRQLDNLLDNVTSAQLSNQQIFPIVSYQSRNERGRYYFALTMLQVINTQTRYDESMIEFFADLLAQFIILGINQDLKTGSYSERFIIRPWIRFIWYPFIKKQLTQQLLVMYKNIVIEN